MTYAPPDPVPSGRPYDVVAVDGGNPSSLDQFIGETVFTISQNDREWRICGLGGMHGAAVRFHEKDVNHDGKDVRVWHIETADEGFTATATAAF
jgi:hypothetical protein